MILGDGRHGVSPQRRLKPVHGEFHRLSDFIDDATAALAREPWRFEYVTREQVRAALEPVPVRRGEATAHWCARAVKHWVAEARAFGREAEGRTA